MCVGLRPPFRFLSELPSTCQSQAKFDPFWVQITEPLQVIGVLRKVRWPQASFLARHDLILLSLCTPGTSQPQTRIYAYTLTGMKSSM